MAVGGPLDADLGHTVERPRLLDGRFPHQDRADEIAVPEPLARARHVAIGDTITLRGYTQAQIQAVLDGVDFPATAEGPEAAIRVVGITREPQDLSVQGSGGGVLYTTREFVRTYGDQIGNFAPSVLLVRVADDVAGRAFVRKARQIVAPLGQAGEFQVQPPSETEGAVQQSIDVLASALLAFALVVAIAGAVIIGIAFRRFVDGSARNVPALRGLGMTHRGRATVLGLPLAPVAAGGAVVGVLGRVVRVATHAARPGADAEPHPGVDVDWLVFGAGLVVVVVVVGVLAALASRAAASSALLSESVSKSGTSSVAAVATRVGASPPVTVGVAMALEPGRGRSAVPVRPAIAGAIVAVLGVVAVGVFGASLADLVATPATYGYNWDAHFTSEEPQPLDPDAPCSSLHSSIVDDDAVAAVAALCSNSVEVDGHAVGAYGLVRLAGVVEPVVLEGRLPRREGEVTLGSDTSQIVEADVGDDVEIAGPTATHQFHVVGRVVLPTFGSDSDVQSVADGAILTGTGLESLSGDGDLSSVDFLVNWRPGADLSAARARIARLPEHLSGARTAAVPLDVTRLDQLSGMPWILGGVLALIGVLGVGYALVTVVRRRARDLAVLKTLGFRRRQVFGTVAMQATVFAGVGLLIGVPLGLVVGRLVWQQVADDAGLRVRCDSSSARPRRCRRRHARRRQPHCRVAGARGSAHASGNRSTIGVTVATSLDHVEPLELTSLRDDARDRPPWSARATGTLALSFTAAVVVALALLISEEATFGPGRVLGAALVAAWCVSAIFVAVHRPAEPLSILMVLGALIGAFALFGAALSVRDAATLDANDWGAAIRAVAVAVLPAVGLQLALGLPDGVLRSAARRVTALLGYVVAAGTRDPPARRAPRRADRAGGGGDGVFALVAIVGFFARCRAARTAHERARMQWVAWAVVVAGAISIVVVVLHALVSWPEPVRGVAVATTVLIPLSLAFGASERIAVRIDRLLVHTITLAGLAAMVAACYLLIVLGLGRAPTGDEQTLLGLSMLAAAVAALLWIPVRERLTDVATRRVYGERHVPDEVLRTFGSRLTRALPLDELLLQLAESLKKTMALAVAEVWTRGTGGLERAVSVPERGRRAYRDRRRGRAGDRACGRVGRRVGEDLVARGARRRRRRAARRTHHQLGRAPRPDRRAAPRGGVAVLRGRRAGPHRARASGRARVAQREARLRAPGVTRRGAPAGRRAPRVPHAHRRSR